MTPRQFHAEFNRLREEKGFQPVSMASIYDRLANPEKYYDRVEAKKVFGSWVIDDESAKQFFKQVTND